jgi:hypothetical protein
MSWSIKLISKYSFPEDRKWSHPYLGHIRSSSVGD